ncbi:MAG: TolC family protein, partial [Gemmataceae bacterium]|nr:TolC family protein [Gemmataceae bacterium]
MRSVKRSWGAARLACATGLAVAGAGCLYRSPSGPPGYPPEAGAPPDARTAALLAPPQKAAPPRADVPPDKGKGKAFDLPPGFPGADGPVVRPPRFTKDTPPGDRLKLVLEAYPATGAPAAPEPPGGEPASLADLQAVARANNPNLRRATADVGVAYGQMIQAGLHPNPTFGYEADQVTPGPNKPANNAGQQGAFVNQLFKFPGKLSLAQSVARYDYINAFVAVRRAEVDVSTAVRTNYFQVLLARKAVEVNTQLVALADEVYQLQLRQVAAGEAAGYEPLQLYAQAVQARNALALARANETANWRQLAAALGRPDLPTGPLLGSVDVPGPAVDAEAARQRVVE